MKIEKGRALVLVGPQGCGKTRLARELAAACGTFEETDAAALQNPSQLGDLLARQPTTIIVDEISAQLIAAPETKSLVASERIAVHRKMCEEEEVPAPNFIFCTNDADALRLNDRRFTVVQVAGADTGIERGDGT